jgi:hypothetical protein
VWQSSALRDYLHYPHNMKAILHYSSVLELIAIEAMAHR